MTEADELVFLRAEVKRLRAELAIRVNPPRLTKIPHWFTSAMRRAPYEYGFLVAWRDGSEKGDGYPHGYQREAFAAGHLAGAECVELAISAEIAKLG